MKKGDLKSAFNKLFKRWSSMPGGSEENKNLEAEKVFKENVSKELKNNSNIETPQGQLNVE